MSTLGDSMLVCTTILLAMIFVVVIYQLIVTYRSNLKYYKCDNGDCKRSIDPSDYASKRICKLACGSNSSGSSASSGSASS